MVVNREVAHMAKDSPVAEMSDHACKSCHFWSLDLIECFLNVRVF